jgi:hypothetical protein
MRTLLSVLALILASGAALAGEYVNGYYRSNGTYVQPHYRSNPNNSTFDNYSTKGNYNPYTGQPGTVDPYYRAPSANGYHGLNDLNYRH